MHEKDIKRKKRRREAPPFHPHNRSLSVPWDVDLFFSMAAMIGPSSSNNLDFYQDMVVGLIVKNNKIQGVKTGLGNNIFSKTVILTNGTFLNGLIHVGEKNFGGGRVGEKSSTGITSDLESYGFISGRMKTGTPPRVDGRSLDYSVMEEEPEIGRAHV